MLGWAPRYLFLVGESNYKTIRDLATTRGVNKANVWVLLGQLVCPMTLDFNAGIKRALLVGRVANNPISPKCWFCSRSMLILSVLWL